MLRHIACFNPHTHTGCDPVLDYAHIGIDSFNPHTPIQGVTYPDIQRFIKRLRFNPHTHTGCDRFKYYGFSLY